MIALLRRNADFRALFLAQVVSFAGDWFATVAMLGLVRDRTGSEAAAAAVFLVQMLPSFLLSPVAGTIVDRHDRRRVMVLVSLAQAGAASLFLVAGSGGPVILAFVAQGLISGLGAFVMPATQAAMPNLVEVEELPTATVMMSSTWGAMLAVGAALGGLFTVAFGRNASFAADVATFLAAGALIATIRRPTQQPREGPHARMQPLRDTVEVARYARRNPTVAALLASKLGFGFGAGTLAMLPLLATEFGGGDGATGLLLAARGVGVVAGPLLARRYAAGGVGGILGACGAAGILYGAGYLVVGSAPVLAVAMAGVLFAHLGGGAQWAFSTLGLQRVIPDEIRGRVFAADFALVTLTLSGSLVVAGVIAEATGPRLPTLVMAGVATVWGTVYLFLTRRLRAADVPSAGLG